MIRGFVISTSGIRLSIAGRKGLIILPDQAQVFVKGPQPVEKHRWAEGPYIFWSGERICLRQETLTPALRRRLGSGRCRWRRRGAAGRREPAAAELPPAPPRRRIQAGPPDATLPDDRGHPAAPDHRAGRCAPPPPRPFPLPTRCRHLHWDAAAPTDDRRRIADRFPRAHLRQTRHHAPATNEPWKGSQHERRPRRGRRNAVDTSGARTRDPGGEWPRRTGGRLTSSGRRDGRATD